MIEASGAHVPSLGWAAAGVVGTILTLWGTLEISLRLVTKATARLRAGLRVVDDGPGPELIEKRQSEALAFLMTMSWQHGHMDLEGVNHAVKTGSPLDEAPCRICGRRRSAASPPQSIGILVMS